MAGWSAAASFPFADNLNFQSIGLFLVAFFLAQKLLRGPKKNLPPGPRGWPIVGNIPALFTSKKQIHEELAAWAQKYGSVMSARLRIGQPARVILSDIHVVKEALVKQADRYCNRFPPPLIDQIVSVPGSYLWESGEASKDHRRFGLTALRSFGVGKKSLEYKINEELRYLIECFEVEENRSFEPLLLVRNAVSNIICNISFGYRFDYADPKFQKLLGVLRSTFETFGPGAIGNAIPLLVNTPYYSMGRALTKTLRSFIIDIVQEHRDSYDPNDYRDIIDLYIKETKQRERDTAKGGGQGRVFTDQHMWRGIMDLFGAGTDTTANAVLWTILYAIKYPEIQDKIQREISEVIGGDRQPSCEDRPNMPYTNAVIMEVLRCRPVAPMAIPYKTNQETQLLGYTIPKDTLVAVNIWAVMHDPKVWERPDEFDPGRFLTKDGQKVVNHEAFIPFGIGRRSCLGENLAKMEVFLFITNLFQRFTFKSPPGAPPPSMVGIGGVMFVPKPCEICAVKR